MKNTSALLVALFASSAALTAAEATSCPTAQEQATTQIKQSPEKVLEIVSKLVASNEACAGHIVKAAIVSTKADKALVAQIVETALTAAPKQASQIANYALAIAPDARTEIASVLKKADANQGTAQAGPRKVSPIEFAGGEIVPFRGFETETNETNNPSSPVTTPPVTR